MATYCVTTIILVLASVHKVLLNPYIDPLDCPLQCNCQRFTVTCTSADVFPENLPEVTQEFLLEDSEIDTIPSNVFLNLKYLTTINITNVKINKVMACAFAELDGVAIKFENSNIGIMEGNSFSNIANSLGIMFWGSDIKQMKSFAFHNLENVMILEIADSNIGTIHPYAFRHVVNISEFSVVNSSIDRFLKEGFSRFYDVEFTYILRSAIREWQCGSVKTGLDTEVNIFVSASSLTCDCTLAWLWRLHPNSSVIHEGSNMCYGNNNMLNTLDMIDICEKEEKQMIGCPQLLPTTPHTCSRAFDTPVEPEKKVKYTNYFSKRDNNSSSRNHVSFLMSILISAIVVLS